VHNNIRINYCIFIHFFSIHFLFTYSYFFIFSSFSLRLHNTAVCVNVCISFNLMFVPCIIRRSRNNQLHQLICTTPLFYILAPTCFDCSLSSSESFLDPSEVLETNRMGVISYNVWLRDLYAGVSGVGGVFGFF
jgi:hypothetical protein